MNYSVIQKMSVLQKLEEKQRIVQEKKNVFSHEKLILGDNCAAKNQVQHEGKAPRAKKGKSQRLHDVQDRPSKKSNSERQHGTQINLKSIVKSSSVHEQAGSKNNEKKEDNKSYSDFKVTEIANFGMEGNSSSILPSKQLGKSVCPLLLEFQTVCSLQVWSLLPPFLYIFSMF